ncbi:membrane lipoprotein lipid attachment site-containing protein, partial [Bacillus spizizenii]|nr:membrane lipoprotein lipid attachment site-containing protein [Bacillus spizizenii]
MKKIMLLLTITAILSACQPNYTGKYIEIGDSLTEYTKECFKEHQIPYQYEKGK